jgi:hypothetical protein
LDNILHRWCFEHQNFFASSHVSEISIENSINERNCSVTNVKHSCSSKKGLITLTYSDEDWNVYFYINDNGSPNYESYNWVEGELEMHVLNLLVQNYIQYLTT